MTSTFEVSGACNDVRTWLSLPTTIVLTSALEHMRLMTGLLEASRGGGDLAPHAYLAPLAYEIEATIYSQGADFARCPEVRGVNPLAG